MKLNGQAALVTGGASGLGAATAKALASAKVKVCAMLVCNVALAFPAVESRLTPP